MSSTKSPSLHQAAPPTLYVESTPSRFCNWPHQDQVDALVRLSDGSFVSCSGDSTIKRWVISTRESSCECLKSVTLASRVRSLFKKRDEPLHVLCEIDDGTIEIRSKSDLSLVTSIDHVEKTFIRQLRDGVFISGCYNFTTIIWEDNGTVTQTLCGHSDVVFNAIELRTDLIVTASNDFSLKMWKESTGECLRTLDQHSHVVTGLEQISQNKFVSGSYDSTMIVWDDNGCCLETIKADCSIMEMTKVGNALVFALTGRCRLEIRELK